MKLEPRLCNAAKRTLEVLDNILPGLPIQTAFDEAENLTGKKIEPLDREYLAAVMEQEGWINHRVCKITGRIIHFITETGRTVYITLC